MSDDSRDQSEFQESANTARSFNASPDSSKPKHASSRSQTGKLWDAFGNPEEPANALAKATYKPPGKNPKDVSYSEIIGSVSLSEMSNVHKRPCARESLMTGIGVGFGVGGLRGVLKGRPWPGLRTVSIWNGTNVLQDGTGYGPQETGPWACLRSPHWEHMNTAATCATRN